MLYIVLLHYPVQDKDGRIVTTSIANMDIHDIARVAKTYDAAGFYIVNPIDKQRHLAQEIVNHWRHGYGSVFNRNRQTAFELIHIKKNLTDVQNDVMAKTGNTPQTVVTGANFSGGVLKFSHLRKMLNSSNTPYLLVFGTGSGIADELINEADYRLEPIKGSVNYNHLSVRSAVAIILDRILGN